MAHRAQKKLKKQLSVPKKTVKCSQEVWTFSQVSPFFFEGFPKGFYEDDIKTKNAAMNFMHEFHPNLSVSRKSPNDSS